MLELLFRGWRTVATGFCFLVFGVGELLEAMLVLPFLVLFIRDLQRRRRVGKWLLYINFRAFVGLMRWVGVLSYETRNLERLQRPGLLVLANHPTLVDVIFLVSFLKRADCIVKGSLLKNPFTRHVIDSAGLIPNSVAGLELVETCIRSINNGNSLVIFPEGSRTRDHQLLPFQRGASQIALRGQKNITPVVIQVNEHNLGRGHSWWKAPKRKVHFIFDVQEDIPIEPFLARRQDVPAAARELTAHLTRYFEQHLESTLGTN